MKDENFSSKFETFMITMDNKSGYSNRLRLRVHVGLHISLIETKGSSLVVLTWDYKYVWNPKMKLNNKHARKKNNTFYLYAQLKAVLNAKPHIHVNIELSRSLITWMVEIKTEFKLYILYRTSKNLLEVVYQNDKTH